VILGFMASLSIERVGPGSTLLSEVLEIHKRYKKTLGFLPRQGFTERAAAGTLIACVDSRRGLQGYALYDLPRAEIRIVHLAVAAAARGSGVARELVDWIAGEHANRHGVKLSCRRDYPANEMWPKLGFTPMAERRGRGQDDTVLVMWWLDFGHPTLFSMAPYLGAPTTTAAIDMNVFVDLVTRRPEGRNSFALQEGWVTEEVELVLTDEVLQEIHRGPDAAQRDSHRLHAAAFRQLRPNKADWQEVFSRLLGRVDRKNLSERDESDIRHVSRASAGEASFLVTRDSDLVKRLGTLAAEVADIQILQPHALIQLLDQRRRQSAYAPAQLEETDLELRKLEPSQLQSVLDPMTIQSRGERGRDLRRLLQTLMSQPMTVSVWNLLEGETPLAVFAEEVGEKSVVLPIVRVRQGPLAHTLARQLLFRSKLVALDHGLSRVEVSDRLLSDAVMSAIQDELFIPDAGGWSFSPLRFLGDLEQFKTRLKKESIDTPAWLKRARRKDGLDLRGVEVERRYWPAKVVDAPIETFVIPIKATYAEALFDVALAEQTLFHRARHLGLARENVYYRSPKGRSSLAAPARIVWYVTSQSRIAGTSQIVACSRLEEVALGPPKAMFQRFKHLGVYRMADVIKASAGGEVMALRFTDTELFPSRVDLRTMRKLAAAAGHGVFLQGPWRITPELFESLYRSGVAA
jgi:GNAT superfamily N-acetyltransferase/predicted nucleic acid-binding protein